MYIIDCELSQSMFSLVVLTQVGCKEWDEGCMSRKPLTLQQN